MPEKIGRPEINIANPEQTKERQDIVREVRATEENDKVDKNRLLEKIYQEGEKANIKPESGESKDIAEETLINKIVREFYSIGSKAIERARKILGAYGLDRLHDEITNKNKSNKQ
jgi:hypothetical protein